MRAPRGPSPAAARRSRPCCTCRRRTACRSRRPRSRRSPACGRACTTGATVPQVEDVAVAQQPRRDAGRDLPCRGIDPAAAASAWSRPTGSRRSDGRGPGTPERSRRSPVAQVRLGEAHLFPARRWSAPSSWIATSENEALPPTWSQWWVLATRTSSGVSASTIERMSPMPRPSRSGRRGPGPRRGSCSRASARRRATCRPRAVEWRTNPSTWTRPQPSGAALDPEQDHRRHDHRGEDQADGRRRRSSTNRASAAPPAAQIVNETSTTAITTPVTIAMPTVLGRRRAGTSRPARSRRSMPSVQPLNHAPSQTLSGERASARPLAPLPATRQAT